MTVKELIGKLQQVDQNEPVIISLDGELREVIGITERICTVQLDRISGPVYTVEITYNGNENLLRV